MQIMPVTILFVYTLVTAPAWVTEVVAIQLVSKLATIVATVMIAATLATIK